MKTILIPKIVWLFLCLGVSSPALLAQFAISGNVAFGEDLEPVPHYEVSVYLPVHNQQYTVKTNSKGDYKAEFDWTSVEILEALVEVVDLCTGELKAVRLPNADSSYVANFILCQGINPPPPPPGCEAHFTFEQLSVNPPTAVFFDLSYHSEPEITYRWDFGDGTTSTEAAPKHDFPAPGVYEVQLSIRTADCASSTVQEVIIQEVLDCVCPAVYNPVCVTLDNGEIITFSNACEAECAGFEEGDWTSCEPNECGCPEFYDPVCVIGANGDTLTFSNHCFAECAGFTPDQFYDCNPINDCNCAPVDAPVCVVNDGGEVLRFANACLARCAGYPESAIVDCNINCICPQIYDPVCVISPAGDSLSFNNACLAECAGYEPDQIFSCNPEPCVCPEYYSPVCVVVAGDTLTFPNICFAECEGYGPNDVFVCNPNGACVDCPDDYKPVCAVDSTGTVITFQNICIANCRGYEDEDLIDCNANCICPAVYDPVCVYTAEGEEIRFSNRCEAECAGYSDDQIVPCEPEDCICPEYYDPVCVVVNGVTRTFDNECFARCAGYTENDFFSCEPKECNCPEIYSPVCIVTDFGPAYWFVNACEAECAGFGPDEYESCGPDDCMCPNDYDLVCAISAQGDTLTFGNPCRAICAGFSEDQLFQCDIPNPCNCDAVYDPVCIYTPGGGVLRFANECEARCAGYDEKVWVKCADTYCQARFKMEHPSMGEMGVQFINRSYPLDSVEVKWLWEFGDGTQSEERDPFHQFAKPGVYTVLLTMFSENCTSSYREQIVVGLDEPIDDCKAMFFFRQSPDNPYFFHFEDRSLGDIVAWNWYFGDGTTSKEAAPEHTYDQPGIYIVSLSVTAADGCTSLVSMLVATDDNIFYNPDCDASFLPVILPDSNLVYFLNFSSQDVLETHWDFGDGTTSDQLMPIHVFPGSGSYTVTLTVVTENGCTNSYSATINLAGASFTASPAYSFLTTTDVDEPELSSLSVKVFPNPVNTELWLDLKEHSGGPMQWRILNLNGQMVLQGQEELNAGQQQFSIQMADLPTGVYALQLISKDGMVTKKFVKDGTR